MNIDVEIDEKKDILNYIETLNLKEKLGEDLEIFIKNILEKAKLHEGIDSKVGIYVRITGNEEIREINREERNKDMVTDILSFPMYSREEIQNQNLEIYQDLEYPRELGDMILNIFRVSEQSVEYQTGIKREIAYMIVHSFYHLLGYDHMIEKEKVEMRRKEEELLKELGMTRD